MDPMTAMTVLNTGYAVAQNAPAIIRGAKDAYGVGSNVASAIAKSNTTKQAVSKIRSIGSKAVQKLKTSTRGIGIKRKR
jgi:nicotinic acid phosphoribosyltransferase